MSICFCPKCDSVRRRCVVHNYVLQAREDFERFLTTRGFSDDDIRMDDHAQEWRLWFEARIYQLLKEVQSA